MATNMMTTTIAVTAICPRDGLGFFGAADLTSGRAAFELDASMPSESGGAAICFCRAFAWRRLLLEPDLLLLKSTSSFGGFHGSDSEAFGQR